MRKLISFWVALSALALSAAEPPAKAEIMVDYSCELGVVKPMNGVNNGPTVSHPTGDILRFPSSTMTPWQFPVRPLFAICKKLLFS